MKNLLIGLFVSILSKPSGELMLDGYMPRPLVMLCSVQRLVVSGGGVSFRSYIDTTGRLGLYGVIGSLVLPDSYVIAKESQLLRMRELPESCEGVAHFCSRYASESFVEAMNRDGVKGCSAEYSSYANVLKAMLVHDRREFLKSDQMTQRRNAWIYVFFLNAVPAPSELPPVCELENYRNEITWIGKPRYDYNRWARKCLIEFDYFGVNRSGDAHH